MRQLYCRTVSNALCIATLVCLGCVVFVPTGPARGGEPTAEEFPNQVPYSIIVTGSELLTGVYADGHTIFVTKTLRPLGLRCVGSVSVDDQEEDIRQALQFTLPRSRLVIVTGGLGPTESDITRDVLSRFTGIALQENPDVLRRMEQRFHTPKAQLRSNLRRQTRVPVKGTYLANDSGTAVGLVFEWEDKVIVALPGPPRELQPMVTKYLTAYLVDKFGVHKPGCSMTIRFVGLGQSQIDETLKQQIHLPSDIMQTSQFTAGRVDFTFSLPGNTPEEKRRLDDLRRDLDKYLGDHIYAHDEKTTLEETVIQRLADRNESVVLAELGSGGAMAAGFAESPGGHHVLAGALVGSEPDQLGRMLEIPTDQWPEDDPDAQLSSIARAAQLRVASDWAIVIGPPGSVSGEREQQLSVLVRTPEGQLLRRTWPWRGWSPASLARLETQLFDLLRQLVPS